jgi:hypothetical protein
MLDETTSEEPLAWVFFAEREAPKRQLHYVSDAAHAADVAQTASPDTASSRSLRSRSPGSRGATAPTRSTWPWRRATGPDLAVRSTGRHGDHAGSSSRAATICSAASWCVPEPDPRRRGDRAHHRRRRLAGDGAGGRQRAYFTGYRGAMFPRLANGYLPGSVPRRPRVTAASRSPPRGTAQPEQVVEPHLAERDAAQREDQARHLQRVRLALRPERPQRLLLGPIDDEQHRRLLVRGELEEHGRDLCQRLSNAPHGSRDPSSRFAAALADLDPLVRAQRGEVVPTTRGRAGPLRSRSARKPPGTGTAKSPADDAEARDDAGDEEAAPDRHALLPRRTVTSSVSSTSTKPAALAGSRRPPARSSFTRALTPHTATPLCLL